MSYKTYLPYLLVLLNATYLLPNLPPELAVEKNHFIIRNKTQPAVPIYVYFGYGTASYNNNLQEKSPVKVAPGESFLADFKPEQFPTFVVSFKHLVTGMTADKYSIDQTKYNMNARKVNDYQYTVWDVMQPTDRTTNMFAKPVLVLPIGGSDKRNAADGGYSTEKIMIDQNWR